MTQDVSFSFLIPVYNAEHHLPTTLDSIIKQDDGTIEIVCVNDGSTDGSMRILQQYAKQYPFIKVFTQQNQGITSARNKALKHATGKWVCFTDNDDIIADNAIKVFHKVDDEDSEIIYFNYEKFTGAFPRQINNRMGNVVSFSDSDITKLQTDLLNRFRDNVPLVSHKVLPTPWAKIYRREFLNLNGLLFHPEVKHEEDIIFNLTALSYCTHAKKVDFIAYYYRWSVTSESHRYRADIFKDVQITLRTYHDVITQRYKNRADMWELYQYRVLWDLLYCVVLGPMHPGNSAPYRERKKQFDHLFSDYPDFKNIFSQTRTTRFEFKQSVLATLIKYRQFWILNLLGSMLNKSR
ncbi:glycosyltransferase family 2 protein [Bifidobacterium eulemuris]|uniref:Glycosyl transferase n=1 Tax=Bifidobacterium eulemuris TaxID=1765219 RepID=A0A261FYS6_9BIFI|nr:glycosyltransferase [Bifidobacterium eulemuris]OZG64354.1 glycosyl transferase [Bifidobacterium eulemuris]QOL32446.1 glycosyltransferase [Bifidobacterium eulemuris]